MKWLLLAIAGILAMTSGGCGPSRQDQIEAEIRILELDIEKKEDQLATFRRISNSDSDLAYIEEEESELRKMKESLRDLIKQKGGID